MITKRFDPFALVESTLFSDWGRLFDSPGVAIEAWTPRVDIIDNDEEFVIRTELAGIDPEDVDITVEEDVLTISGTRSLAVASEDDSAEFSPRYVRREIVEGKFSRKIRLASEVDFDAVKATSTNGIIEVTLPKQPAALPRKVTVDVQR